MSTRNTRLERRHFALIADVLSSFTDTSEGRAIALAFAKRLKSTNERFQAARFLEACGIEDYDSSFNEPRPRCKPHGQTRGLKNYA